MAAGHACNWVLNAVLFCVLFFVFGPNDYCNACINSREWLCIETSVQPWISYNVFSRNNMLTKSRAGLLSVIKVPFYSNFSATFSVEYLCMCGDINLILDLSRQEHICTESSRVVARHHRATKCDSSMWTHIQVLLLDMIIFL